MSTNHDTLIANAVWYALPPSKCHNEGKQHVRWHAHSVCFVATCVNSTKFNVSQIVSTQSNASQFIPTHSKPSQCVSIPSNPMRCKSHRSNSTQHHLTSQLHNTSHHHITLPFGVPLDSFWLHQVTSASTQLNPMQVKPFQLNPMTSPSIELNLMQVKAFQLLSTLSVLSWQSHLFVKLTTTAINAWTARSGERWTVSSVGCCNKGAGTKMQNNDERWGTTQRRSDDEGTAMNNEQTTANDGSWTPSHECCTLNV